MVQQHMPHYQPLRRCEHFKVRTCIAVTENVKIHIFLSYCAHKNELMWQITLRKKDTYLVLGCCTTCVR